MWQIPQLTPLQINELLKKVHAVLRLKHYSIRTEESYVRWIQYFLRFQKNQDPTRMGQNEVRNFLTHLAVQRKVAAATQNQASSRFALPL